MGQISDRESSDTDILFQAVAARQLHYNALLWQVPVLSLTAQAFLFTVALDASSSRTARLIASLLALVTTLVSMQLMARHRQGDVADARWLQEFEERRFGQKNIVHGLEFKQRRDAFPVGGILARVPYSFVLWMAALALFGTGAITVLVVELIAPDLLAG